MDRRGVLVDRSVPVALFERLYLRDGTEPGPPPIVLINGPGGSGRTRLLDYLYARGKDPLTCALVRVTALALPSAEDTQAKPRPMLELLDDIQEELAADPHPQCGLIRFPRYELAKWMRTIAPELGIHPDHEALRAKLADLLKLRFRPPNEAGQATQNIIVIALVWLIGLLLPAFLAKPSLFRLLLWGRHRNTGFVWYERHQRDINLPSNRHIGDVIRKVCALYGGGDAADLDALDRLSLSAFLDDLRAAYGPKNSRARLRTAYCVALVDDIDALPDGQGFRLLDLLAEQRASSAWHDPLLLVATSGRRLSDPDYEPRPPLVAAPDSATVAAADPVVAAKEIHTSWLDDLHRSRDQGRYPTSRLFLSLDIPPLGRAEAWCLTPSNQRRGPTTPDEVLAEEIFQATHGHPLAIDLVMQALENRRPGAPRLGTRHLMDEPLPADAPDAGPARSIRDVLLDRFLTPVERLPRDQLAACALPRALDIPTVQATLGLQWDEDGRQRATEIWDNLSGYAFTEIAPDGRLSIHPLLRDLLIRELADDSGTGPLSYAATHARLAKYYAVVAEAQPDAVVDLLYHELAIGRVQTVMRRLSERIGSDSVAWREEMLAVARAPSSRRSSGRIRDELREWTRARLRRGDDSVGTLLEQARNLYAPTSDTAWSPQLLRGLQAAIGEVEDGARQGGGRSRQLRPFEETDDAAHRDGGHDLVRDDEDTPFYVPRRTSWRGLWRVAAAVVLLAPILAYLGAYRAYSVETCGPVGPLRVWTVLNERLVDDGRYVRHAGPRGRGPCIGITDGENYTFGTGKGITHVQRAIAKQNEQVLQANASTGRPYVTAVVMTTLTASGTGDSTVARAGRSELEGVYLAQRRYNEAGYVPMLRVLIANSGGNARHAEQVARQIVHAAKDGNDETIVAVLGLGYGAETTLRAARVLDNAGLPVIASTASSDAFGNNTSRFFRVAVPNERQAAVAAAYAKRTLGAETAIVIEDPTDEYSHDLARDFVSSFRDDEHRMIYIGPLKYDASDPGATNVLDNQVDRACRQNPDLIFYAGRTSEVDTLLNAMADPPCDPSITIMAGHAMSLMAVPPLPKPLPEVDNPFYYTAMAARTAWRPGQAPPFFRAYRNYLAMAGLGPNVDALQTNTRAALAYDATSALTSALALAPDSAHVDRFVVWRRIGLTTGPFQLAGAGGVIDFGVESTGDPARKAVMLMRVEKYGEARWIGSCGQVAVNPRVVASPPERIPCPGGGKPPRHELGG